MYAAMPTQTQQYVYGNKPETPPVTPGRLRQEGLDESYRNITIIMHLSLLAGLVFSMGPFAVLLPVAFWFIYRSKSEFINDHGREVINFGLSMILFSFAVITIPFIIIILLVNTIRAAKASHRGEYFRYPITLRFLS